jgi:hypothetical protein
MDWTGLEGARNPHRTPFPQRSRAYLSWAHRDRRKRAAIFGWRSRVKEVLPAVVAAIGNAFFDATGVRLRQFPLTPQRVLAALKSAPTSPNRSA